MECRLCSWSLSHRRCSLAVALSSRSRHNLSLALTNRMQYVVVNGVASKPLSVISGVPQGSVLGPLLFLIFINGIAELPLSPESKLVMYADDILLYRPIRQASDYQLLQQDVEALGEWANNNYLTFNPAKSKSLPISN